MKALIAGLSILLSFTIALCFAYKNKLQEANRYIEWKLKDCVANHSVKIGRYEIEKGNKEQPPNSLNIWQDAGLVLSIQPISFSTNSKLNLAATNLVLVTKHVPIMNYDSNENFVIRFAP